MRAGCAGRPCCLCWCFRFRSHWCSLPLLHIGAGRTGWACRDRPGVAMCKPRRAFVSGCPACLPVMARAIVRPRWAVLRWKLSALRVLPVFLPCGQAALQRAGAGPALPSLTARRPLFLRRLRAAGTTPQGVNAAAICAWHSWRPGLLHSPRVMCFAAPPFARPGCINIHACMKHCINVISPKYHIVHAPNPLILAGLRACFYAFFKPPKKFCPFTLARAEALDFTGVQGVHIHIYSIHFPKIPSLQF